MKLFARAISNLLIAAPVMLAGCATYDMTKTAPPQSRPISVVYSNEGPSGWSDLPIGTYQVPNSTVIISGHQEGGGIGVIFGPIGLLAQGAVNSGIGKGAVNNVEAALHVDLTPQADALTKTILASGKFGQAFAPAPDPNGPTLLVQPFVVITFASDTDVNPYVFLKTTLKASQSGGSVWATRYISSSGKPVPLTGENSLTANSGELLKSILALELKRAVEIMLDDVAKRHARAEGKSIYVESVMPYIRQRMGNVGYELADDGETLAYVPKIADANVFAGVHILDKSVTTYRAATADDKIKFLEDGK